MTETPATLSTKNASRIGIGIAAACCATNGSSEPGDDRQGKEQDEPRNGLAGVVEEQGSKGALERPQAHRARSHVAAKAPLEQERQQDDEEELAESEEAVALRPGEQHKARDRHELVGERDRGRFWKTQGEVGAHPDDGEPGHRHRGQGEGHLLDADLLRVVLSDADERELRDEPTDPGARSAHDEAPRDGEGRGTSMAVTRDSAARVDGGPPSRAGRSSARCRSRRTGRRTARRASVPDPRRLRGSRGRRPHSCPR